MLDRVGDLLMARAERSDVREEQALCLDARSVLTNEGAKLIADFERHLRQLVDDRLNGKVAAKADFATVDAKKLTLIETSTMDESVLSGNIVRVVENQCESELREFNRAVGYLLGRPDLETAANPLAPTTIVEAFTDALHGIPGDQRLKLAILKELNQTSLGDINEIYADLNRHLESLKVVPEQQRSPIVNGVAGRRIGRRWRCRRQGTRAHAGRDGAAERRRHRPDGGPATAGQLRRAARVDGPAPARGPAGGGMQFSGLGRGCRPRRAMR